MSLPSPGPGRSGMKRGPWRAGRVRLRAEVLLWRQGWAWLVGPLCLVLSLGLWYGVLVPRQQALLESRLQVKRLLERPSVSKAAVAPPPLSAADRGEAAVELLHASLGPHAGVGLQLRRLYALATKQNLLLSQSDYQRVAVPAQGIERLQVTFPFKANYPQLRRFMESVLLDMPNVSIDQLSFKRVQVSQSQVDVRLRLSLWVNTPWPSTASTPASGAVPGRQP